MSEEKPRQDFPSFWEGLSLREHGAEGHPNLLGYFPTFLQGLSLRRAGRRDRRGQGNPVSLPFGRTFIETAAHPGLRRKHLNLPYLCRDFP